MKKNLIYLLFSGRLLCDFQGIQKEPGILQRVSRVNVVPQFFGEELIITGDDLVEQIVLIDKMIQYIIGKAFDVRFYRLTESRFKLLCSKIYVP